LGESRLQRAAASERPLMRAAYLVTHPPLALTLFLAITAKTSWRT
jgi:hypothetical protein